jgi:hypothetical protein
MTNDDAPMPADPSARVPWTVGMAIAAVLSNELNALQCIDCDWSEPWMRDYLMKCLKVLDWCNANGFTVVEQDNSHRELFKQYLGVEA